MLDPLPAECPKIPAETVPIVQVYVAVDEPDVNPMAVVAPEQIVAGFAVVTVETGLIRTVIVFAVPAQPLNVGVTIYCTVPIAVPELFNV